MQLGGAHHLNLQRSGRKIGAGSTSEWCGQPHLFRTFGRPPPPSLPPGESTSGWHSRGCLLVIVLLNFIVFGVAFGSGEISPSDEH
jgi:hypothetical protein